MKKILWIAALAGLMTGAVAQGALITVAAGETRNFNETLTGNDDISVAAGGTLNLLGGSLWDSGATTTSWNLFGDVVVTGGAHRFGDRMQGSGSVSIIGTNATLSLYQLQSNTLEFNFELAATGVGTINCSSWVKFTGSTLNIDASALSDSSAGTFTLFDCVGSGYIYNLFNLSDVTITGLTADRYTFVQSLDTDDVKLIVGPPPPPPPVPTNHLAKVMALGDLTNAPAVYTTNGVVTNVNCVGSIQSIMYDGQDYTGKATRVWAYIGMPAGASATNPVPAVVCAHGGGGTAFSEWVQKWNDRGYAAISMDNEGRMHEAVHAWSGPQRSGVYGDTYKPIEDQFMYHATADAILANSLLRSLPEIDADKIGLTGISWGGVITATAIGIDDRFAFAIPIYGCGHMYDALNNWGASLGNNEMYKTVWDPILRMENATMPVLWLSWPTDYHFPMDCQAYTYHPAPGEHMVSLVPGMIHGHTPGWERPEGYDFADNILNKGTGWCVQQSIRLTGSDVEVVFAATRPLKTASLIYTTGTGKTGDLVWPEINVTSMVESPAGIWTITAQLPANATGWFVNTTADANVAGYRGGGDVIASSDYQEVIHLISTPSDQLEISHPVFTNQSASTVAIAFTAPTNVEISDIRLSGQSHPGAFTNLTMAPMVLRNAAVATSIGVKFNNTVAGLTNGQSATATLIIVWDELDGTTDQIELPLRASAWGGTNAVYGTWALSNGLSGTSAELSADPDSDSFDNLVEYALGGNPTNAASTGYDATASIVSAGGTNWFYYVYPRRRDAAARSLSYTVQASTNLVTAGWSTNGVTETGAGIIDSAFESVTNRSATGEAGFVRLKIGLAE
jgi:dienelactone hydrolase